MQISSFQETFPDNQPTLLVVILHSDDLSSCGFGIGQNGSGVQGFDGEWVNHTDVLPYSKKLQNQDFKDTSQAYHQTKS